MDNDASQECKENSIIDEVAEETADSRPNPRRRIQDGITSKDPARKMDLDRRYKDSERRCKFSSVYKGWARRLTVDRRLTTKDRRKTK